MKEILITQLVSVLMHLVTPDVLKTVVDQLLDAVETAVEQSETKVDDAIVLGLCNTVRRAFDIPDND